MNILDGGPHDPGGDPPDIPPSSSGAGASAVASNPALITPSGGLTGIESLMLLPFFDTLHNTNGFGTFDYTDFDTESDCFHEFRQEEIIQGRKITVSLIRIVYRDIGKAIITAGIEFAPEDSESDWSQELIIGSDKADGELHTIYANADVGTGERPQLIITRFPNDGPVAIISAGFKFTVEVAEQM